MSNIFDAFSILLHFDFPSNALWQFVTFDNTPKNDILTITFCV